MRRPSAKHIAISAGAAGFLGLAAIAAYVISREDAPSALWADGRVPSGHYETLDGYAWKTQAQVFVGPTGKTIERTLYSDERPYVADGVMLCWDGPALEMVRGNATPLAPGSCIERVIADAYNGGIAQISEDVPRLRITDTQQN